MPITNLGPGDEATWPAYTGHPNDPRNDDDCDDDSVMHQETADEMAADQISSTAGHVAEWLNNVCDTDAGWEPVETMKINEADLQDAPVHVLLAVVMTGTDHQAKYARMWLRDRFEADNRDSIDDRASELLLAANGRPDNTPDGYRDDYDD